LRLFEEIPRTTWKLKEKMKVQGTPGNTPPNNEWKGLWELR
jgi:hypothetical protein